MKEVQNYLSKINQRYFTGISREHSYRGDLQSLLETLLPGVLVTNEPAHIACGAPDYILTKAHIPLGYHNHLITYQVIMVAWSKSILYRYTLWEHGINSLRDYNKTKALFELAALVVKGEMLVVLDDFVSEAF